MRRFLCSVKLHEGTAGVHSVSDLHELSNFLRRMEVDETPDRYDRWLITIRSTSPKRRRAMLDYFEQRGYTHRPFTRTEMDFIPTQISAGPKPSLTWRVFTSPLSAIATICNTIGLLLGYGNRTYFVVAPPRPAPGLPPNAGVREPRAPLPTLDSGSMWTNFD